MKSRKKLNLPNKPVIKRSESCIVDKPKLQLPKKRNSSSSTSLRQNLEFWQEHSKFFSKNLHSCGDADSYFKQSLRNYQHADVNSFRSRSNRILKATSSIDSLQKVRGLAARHSSIKKKPAKSADKRKLQPSISATKVDSEDTEVFYSPSSNTLKSSGGSTHTLKHQDSQSSLESTKIVDFEGSESEPTPKKMAEDMDEEEFTGLVGETEADTAEEAAVEEREATDVEYEAEEEDDEMKEVERIIQQASAELEQVAEENQQLFGDLGEGEDEEGESQPAVQSPAAGDGSIFKFDPAIDAAVLRELEDAEKQAKETAKIILDLKVRVTELLKKEKTTEAEARELEQKNKELRTHMLLFEEKTKRIQFLIAQTNLFDNMIPPKTPLQVKHTEDILPKVIVCGMTEHNIPKLIMCDEKKKKQKSSCCKTKDMNIPLSVVPKFAKRLSDSYTMQEKLAAENADLEGTRYKLQSDLLSKDQTIEYLQRKLCAIQCEMRMISKENSTLNDKIQQICCQKQETVKPKKMPCGKNKGACPADIENRLNEYSETTKILEKQLCDMETDVKTMQTELTAVQAEREHLEQHRKILICPPICLPHPCGPPPPCAPPVCPPVHPCAMPQLSPADQQLRELKEQYNRLQDDFKSKVTEVAALRADNEILKSTAKDAEELRKAAEDKVKDCERVVKTLKLEKSQYLGSKEQLIEQEQQLVVAKQRFREAQDELEELRAFIQDQQGQLDDYRNKYLEAQQQVEEQRRQIDLLEMDANRINEQVNLEIQRVKSQFQEKLQELLPLPDLLKTTQLKLQEAQQMHLLAERNNEALTRDLQVYKDKVSAITNQMEMVRSDQQLGADEKLSMTTRLEQMENKLNELQEENGNLKDELTKTEDLAEENDRKVQEKLHEIAQLSAQLETVREESARQVARNKERCETVRRSMQNQISDLERQLAQSRAQARSAQKDRDEIRQKMQSQINNLHENFEDAQMRIRNLQGHVNFLKDSYKMGNGIGDADSTTSDNQDPCNCDF